jgi:hypothetical protein
MTLKKYLPTYLIMISYGHLDKVIDLIKIFRKTSKPEHFSKFIIIENSPDQLLNPSIDFLNEGSIHYEYINNSNKASLINYSIQKLITEEEALIILIDNDISFKEDFLINYYNKAIEKGAQYFFGGSLKVNMPENVDEKIKPYLSISATGKSDEAYLKQKEWMFLGANYAFFKSQWNFVNGFDERFSAGSENKLGADESVFQKKLKFVGFQPCFVKNNEVQHLIDIKLYDKKNILMRFKNNGFTHGFQSLITTQGYLKSDYLKKLIYLFKRFILLVLKGETFDAKFKFFYFLGFLNAFFLFIKIENKTSYLDGLFKDSVKINQ